MAINKLLNIMRLQSETVSGNYANTRFGTISSYDPNNYAVKVLLQPDGTESGWLPIGSPWTGNGWGMFSPPPVGTMVKVHFQEGNPEAGVIDTSHFNDSYRPVPVTSGEFWLVHSTGSAVKIQNDGSISIISNGVMNVTSGGQVNINATGKVVATSPEYDLTGNVKVTGDIQASGNISDATGSMATMRSQYNPHTHGGGPPASPQMT